MARRKGQKTVNIKIVYEDHIDAWDTRADGSASTSHAVLRVNGRHLELWSDLRFEEGYDPEKSGQAKSSRTEEGKAESILSISAENAPRDLKTWLAAAHAESGLLRFDIDGETFYAYEEPDESDEVIYEYEEQDKAGNVFDVSETAVYDHMHPTTASLKAAVNRYPRNK